MRDDTFNRLYPDIDPARALPPRFGEILALAVSSAVLAYGAVLIDLNIVLVGLVLFLISAIMPRFTTHRRIRQEAKDRFPDQNWAEKAVLKRTRAIVMVPILWAILTLVCLLCAWLVPLDYRFPAAGACAIFAAILVFIMPGISQIWGK